MNALIDKTRWWIPPPGSDESLRSVLSRAAALYECMPGQLWASLNQDDAQPCGDIDSPSCPALLRIAQALGARAVELLPHRLADEPWRLLPDVRQCFCPACWNEDLRAGRPRTLRRAWSHVLRIRCQTHGLPLCLAQGTWATSTSPYNYQIPKFTPEEQGVLDLIESFGTALEQSLFFGSPWPEGWRGTPQAVRSLLGALSFNQDSRRNFPPIRNVEASGGLSSVICYPRHMQEPLKGSPWEAFRAIANPGIRRAALWVAAWNVVPDLPAASSPGWVKLPDSFKF